MVDTVEIPGEPVAPTDLANQWAAAFVRYVQDDNSGSFVLQNCRCATGWEAITILVRAEVPQQSRYDIRYEEPLAVVFDLNNERLPEVLALRKDFPQVPHLNLRREQIPKSLCLFAENPNDVKLRWTPVLLGKRILWWLKETARGSLHQQDQALEPFFGGITRPLIIPPDIFSSGAREVLQVYHAPLGDGREVLLADTPGTTPSGLNAPEFSLFAFKLPTQETGVIHVEPQTLFELQLLCSTAGYDLFEELRAALREGIGRVLGEPKGTILVLEIPKQREAGMAIERSDIFGFRCRIETQRGLADIGPGKLGELLGVLGPDPTVASVNPRYVPLLQTGSELAAANIRVELLMPQKLLTPVDAAFFSGHQDRIAPRILAVGQGALGSQLFENLVRQGFGEWTLIDEDFFAPHNAVRHAIMGKRYGLSKAVQMASLANETFAGPPIAKAINADVLAPGVHAEEIRIKARDADVILDMSVSVPVARHLALDLESNAKRISTFLSPTGLDLVVMSEGAGRSVPLDVIESQYNRAVVNDERLVGHLQMVFGQVRYGGSCRDISSRISQETVALHAAIGAKAVRDAVVQSGPSLSIWRCDREQMTVARYDIPVEPAQTITVKDWTIVTDDGLHCKLTEYRAQRLPRETCGVLLGYLDTMRRRIYVVDALPAPPDSVEEPDGCERGIIGLNDMVRSASERSLHQVDYIGEWHSHPDGASCSPSIRDLAQMEWVKARMNPEGKPALIGIVCAGERITFLVTEP